MCRNYLRVVAGAIAVLCAVSGAGAQYAIVSVKAVDVDSLYPHWWKADEGRYFPGLIGLGTDAVTIGGIGAETHVAWKDVLFPCNPLGMVVSYASPQESQIEFYEDGLDGPGTMFFWYCVLPQNADGWRPVAWSDTSWIDYTLFQDVPNLSGTHEIFLKFSCGGAGCLDLARIDFLFPLDPAGKTIPHAARRRSGNQGNPGLVIRGHADDAGSRGAHVGILYDIRGRSLVKAPAAGSGLVVVNFVLK